MEQTISFFDARPYDRHSFDAVNEEFGFNIKYYDSHLNADTAVLCRDSQAACIFVNDTADKDVIDRMYEQGVRVLALRCAGYNNVDLVAAYDRMAVVRVPAYSPYAVAEHATALILALNRKTHRAYYRTRENNFNINGLMGFDLHGKTVGVVGTGKIGQVFIGIMRGFGMDVVAFDPFPKEETASKLGCRYVDLDELYRVSDVISLHCPLTPENVHMINDEAIEKMKTGVMLINTGRGQLIDTRALVEGLKNRKIGGAGLDVYEEEDKYFFEDLSSEIVQDDVLARLLSFPNVLVTSHQAFFTHEAMSAIAHTTLENLREFFAGEKLTNEVCRHCKNHPKPCECMRFHGQKTD
jgi:D-lactate dehydrogenase